MARKSDIRRLAQLHIEELPSQFLSSLGNKFLQKLYFDFYKDKGVSIFVSENSKYIQGFIVGAKNFDRVFKRIIIRNFIKYSFIIFPQFVKNPKILKQIIETSFYTRKIDKVNTDAELVVIAVSKRYHREGIGKKLVLELEKWFLLQGLKMYKVSVTASNNSANLFYSALGFKKNQGFLLYGKFTNLFVKKII